MGARGSLSPAGELWVLEVKPALTPQPFYRRGDHGPESGWQMQGHTARTLGKWEWEKAVPSQVSTHSLSPAPKRCVWNVGGKYARGSVPLPGPGRRRANLSGGGGGKCRFGVSFQPHRSHLRCPTLLSSLACLMPSCHLFLSNPAVDPGQSA